jgi:hypothetical protein
MFSSGFKKITVNHQGDFPFSNSDVVESSNQAE